MKARSAFNRSAASCANEVKVLLVEPSTRSSGPIAVDGREVALLLPCVEPSPAARVLGVPAEPEDGKSSLGGSQEGIRQVEPAG
jgi:hypothetical protein